MDERARMMGERMRLIVVEDEEAEEVAIGNNFFFQIFIISEIPGGQAARILAPCFHFHLHIGLHRPRGRPNKCSGSREGPSFNVGEINVRFVL